MADIDVIIITYNSKKFIEPCIDSLLNSLGERVDITVVDNASADDTVAIIKEKYPSVKVLEMSENVGYARAVNKGAENVSGKSFVIANADVVFHENTVKKLITYLMDSPDAGVVGPQQVFPDGKWQRSYGSVPGIWDSIRNTVGITSLHNSIRRFAWPKKIDKRPKEVEYVDGAVMAIRREAFESIGGFDGDFFFYAEEVDFCLRLKKTGWKVVFLPSAVITHVRGGSSKKADSRSEKYLRLYADSKLRFVRKRYSGLQIRFFIVLERVHAIKTSLVCRVAGSLMPKSKKRRMLSAAEESARLAKIWSEQ